jgi:hypothetical protein
VWRGRRLIHRVELLDQPHEFLRLGIRRDLLVVAQHDPFTGVVRGERKRDIAGEQRKQRAQVTRPHVQIDRRIQQLLGHGAPLVVIQAIALRGFRNHLHEADGALWRNSFRFKRGFHGDHRLHQRDVDVLLLCIAHDHRSNRFAFGWFTIR